MKDAAIPKLNKQTQIPENSLDSNLIVLRLLFRMKKDGFSLVVFALNVIWMYEV